MGKILSIDYGRKRIGLAISEEREQIAFTLKSLTSEKFEILFSMLERTIREVDPAEILIGSPLGIDGKETQMSIEIDTFIERLKDIFSIKITKWNETGTSKIAQINLRGSKLKDIDSESARIILQEYLDFKNEK